MNKKSLALSPSIFDLAGITLQVQPDNSATEWSGAYSGSNGISSIDGQGNKDIVLFFENNVVPSGPLLQSAGVEIRYILV
jgi:hypothetical protein